MASFPVSRDTMTPTFRLCIKGFEIFLASYLLAGDYTESQNASKYLVFMDFRSGSRVDAVPACLRVRVV